ncbi:hypodermin-A-like [Hermetia illucens]|uniref:hypodermin-A-like n=1 Tax=Hermetia illucens TaxID=343691 RepID=UPI0018CBFFAD|nr:hypodermin-A-like [Hermetia illucens]
MKNLFLLAILISISFISQLYGFRIVNGTEAKFGEFPFAVALITIYGNGIPFCSGSLITSVNVLTTAHCFRKPHDLWGKVVLAGEIDPLRPSYERPPPSRQLRRIISVTNHPKAFDGQGKTNREFDVGIIKVAEAFILSANVATISIAKKTLPNRSSCVAIGFGRNVEGPDGYHKSDRKLRYGKFIINSSKCDFQKGAVYCIYSRKRMTLFGDSGGPLIDRYPWQKYQYGVDSGSVIRPKYKVSFYTNVALHRRWIIEQLGYKSSGTRTSKFLLIKSVTCGFIFQIILKGPNFKLVLF